MHIRTSNGNAMSARSMSVLAVFVDDQRPPAVGLMLLMWTVVFMNVVGCFDVLSTVVTGRYTDMVSLLLRFFGWRCLIWDHQSSWSQWHVCMMSTTNFKSMAHWSNSVAGAMLH